MYFINIQNAFLNAFVELIWPWHTIDFQPPLYLWNIADRVHNTLLSINQWISFLTDFYFQKCIICENFRSFQLKWKVIPNFFYTTVYNQWSWSTVYVPAGWTHSMPENTVLASIAWSYWSKTRISNPWFLLFWTIQSFAACWTGMDTHVLDVQGTNAVQRIRWRTTVTKNSGKSKLNNE